MIREDLEAQAERLDETVLINLGNIQEKKMEIKGYINKIRGLETRVEKLTDAMQGAAEKNNELEEHLKETQ